MYSCTELTSRMSGSSRATPFMRVHGLGEPRLQPICEREIDGLDETGDFHEVALVST